MRNSAPEQIDELLPQTQCGLCGYGGCMPYAEALAFENAPINLCPPGGVETLHALGSLFKEDPSPYVAEMECKAKPPLVAVIREAECIGCAKCISACPVDAIIGSAKQMHSIITTECTGCELCIPPCPVDCIDLISISSSENKKEKSDRARKRFQTRERRIAKEKSARVAIRSEETIAMKKRYIEEAINRAKAKKIP